MTTLRLASAIVLLAVLFGGVPARAQDPVRYRDVMFGAVTVTEGLVYEPSRDLALDLYEPAGDTETARASIVLAHGGGFTSGSRDSMAPIAEAFARRGFVAASISYRLDPDLGYEELIIGSLAGQMPEAMQNAQYDMQAAVRSMRANAEAYRIDPDLISAGGVSAGASMALETAYNPEDDADTGPIASHIAAAVSISGATDPRRIEAGAPPVILFHGVLDTTAPFPVALLTVAGATGQGNHIELTPYPTDGHNLGAHTGEMIDGAALFLCAQVLGCA